MNGKQNFGLLIWLLSCAIANASPNQLQIDCNKKLCLIKNLHISNFSLENYHIRFNDANRVEFQNSSFAQLPSMLMGQFTSLNKLTATNCSIQNVGQHFHWKNQHILDNLDTLDLDDNKIENLTNHLFGGAQNLKNLYLDNNEIEAIEKYAFYGLQKLEVLSLDGNRIATVSPFLFGDLRSLTDVHLNHNQIARFEMKWFVNNTKLVKFVLSDNNLTRFEFTDLPNLPELMYAGLGGNNLTELVFESTVATNTTLPALRKISIYRNRWNCSYLKEMLDAFDERNISIWYPPSKKVQTIQQLNVNGTACTCALEKKPSTNHQSITNRMKSHLTKSIAFLENHRNHSRKIGEKIKEKLNLKSDSTVWRLNNHACYFVATVLLYLWTSSMIN